MPRPLLLLDVVGLTPRRVGTLTPALARLAGEGTMTPLRPPLPAVTCTSQATILTGGPPREHGIVGNGWYFRDLAQVWFWRRSDRLVGGEKIWEAARGRDPALKVANVFWRHATHSSCDVVITERPAYWSDGRKSPDIFTEPAGLRDELVSRVGGFPLFRFWGPASGIESTRWIADATLDILRTQRPGLLLTYLPHLDYDLQRYGPDGPAAEVAHRDVDAQAGRLVEAARAAGMDVAVVSEYGLERVEAPVYPNRVLRGAGYVRVDRALNGELLEPGACRAFAVCDHQVAHVYVRDARDIADVRNLLERTDGVERVLDEAGKREALLDHPRSGELVAIAAPGRWFAYPYWLDEGKAPDFARCVDIHQKPGYDPGELFLAPGLAGRARLALRLAQKFLRIRAPFDVVGLDPSIVRGSHGRIPTRAEDGPLLLTSWRRDADGTIPMTDVKSILLERMFS